MKIACSFIFFVIYVRPTVYAEIKGSSHNFKEFYEMFPKSVHCSWFQQLWLQLIYEEYKINHV